jgi:hypothetical protein
MAKFYRLPCCTGEFELGANTPVLVVPERLLVELLGAALPDPAALLPPIVPNSFADVPLLKCIQSIGAGRSGRCTKCRCQR